MPLQRLNLGVGQEQQADVVAREVERALIQSPHGAVGAGQPVRPVQRDGEIFEELGRHVRARDLLTAQLARVFRALFVHLHDRSCLHV